MAWRDTEPVLRCSFCGKSQAEVGQLIAGPNVFICDECVQSCTEIIRQDASFEPKDTVAASEPSTPSTSIVACRLCGMNVPWDDGLPIPHRGFLCAGCAGEVEAQIAERAQGGSEQ